MSKKSLAIIGGGAAGIFAAIKAAENKNCTNITVFEASSMLLDKVKISGGGRCNVTHNCFEQDTLIENYPRGKQFLKRLFYQFQPQDTVDWFQRRNVKLKTEKDGRMFPVTNSSQTIIDCFLFEIKKHNIKIKYNCRMKEIQKNNNKFVLSDNKNEKYIFDTVLIATGSSKIGYVIAESLGHSKINTVPSLFTFKIKDKRLSEMSGVACQNMRATLNFGKKKFQQTGPMLITHWGMSGPAILKLSAFAAKELHENKYHTELKINFAPDMIQTEVQQLLEKYKLELKQKNINTLHPFKFPKSLWKNILEYTGISNDCNWGEISKKEINKLTEQICNSTFQVTGKGIFKEEFVTCGGVALKEVEPQTMQSTICDNLYFAGEVLDIDGITGGFNFQSAWTTGYIAGNSI